MWDLSFGIFVFSPSPIVTLLLSLPAGGVGPWPQDQPVLTGRTVRAPPPSLRATPEVEPTAVHVLPLAVTDRGVKPSVVRILPFLLQRENTSVGEPEGSTRAGRRQLQVGWSW
jgi:hypothetical protein